MVTLFPTSYTGMKITVDSLRNSHCKCNLAYSTCLGVVNLNAHQAVLEPRNPHKEVDCSFHRMFYPNIFFVLFCSNEEYLANIVI